MHVKPQSLAEVPIKSSVRLTHTEPLWVQRVLITFAVLVMLVLIVIPVLNVFYQALSEGFGRYWEELTADSDTRHAVWMTLTVAPVSVFINTVFGVAVAWAVTKFNFRGRTLLISIIDLPFAVSPIVAGLMIMLLFGMQGIFGPWLKEHGIQIPFTWYGLVVATTFVTLPFVARELIPVMEALGADEELAAVSLGANGWQVFWRVTIPNIKWGLLYGVILCNARAMGEFGAVHVTSGRIGGETDTMPLRIEKLIQGYNSTGAFAIASVLTMLALVTLFVKTLLEHQTRQTLEDRKSELQGVIE